MQENCSLNLIYTCGALEIQNYSQVGAFRFELGKSLGREIKESLPKVDYVVPVPNSGLYYAMGVAETLGVTYLQSIIKMDSSIRSLRLVDQTERVKEISQNMGYISSFIKGKKIVLVDEAIFSGTTLKTVVSQLYSHEVAEIHIAISTPPCRNACKHLPQKSLLAQKFDVSEMKEHFSVDSIHFLSKDQFITQMEEFSDTCYSCFI